MRAIAWALMLGVAGLSGPVAAWAAGTVVDPRVREFEAAAEARIRDSVERLYGDAVRPVVAVRAQLEPEAAPEPPPASAGKKSEPSMDLGYVPFPVVPGFWKEKAPAAEPVPSFPRIRSITAQVRLLADVDQGEIPTQEVEPLIKSLFPGLSVSIHVDVLRKPLLKKKPPDKAPEADDKPKEAPPIDWARWALIAGGVLGALGLAMSISSVGRAMVASARALAEGLSESLSKRDPGGARKPLAEQAKAAAKNDEPGGKKGAQTLNAGVEREDVLRSIQVLRSVFKQEPSLLIRSLGSTERDSRGMRRLLTFLDEGELSRIAGALGQFRLDRLVELGQGELAVDDFSQWLKGLSEEIAVRRLQGGSDVEKALGPERLLKLSSVPYDELLKQARQAASPADWRIALELVPSSELGAAIHAATETEREAMVSAAEAGAQELVQAADRMLQGIATGGEGDNVIPIRGKSRRKFFESRLSGPILAELLACLPGEDDAFLDRLAGGAPDFVELVRSRIWTPRDLADVPDDYLGKTVRTLTHEERLWLVLALPGELADKVRDLTPEGNAKTILLDRIRKALAKPDPAQKTEAIRFAREFLARLREDELRGSFQRGPAGGGAGAPPGASGQGDQADAA